MCRWMDGNTCFLVSSTILEEEKQQQKERSRMEMRRQVTVSWDSGGSDEAPPKVGDHHTLCVCVSVGPSCTSANGVVTKSLSICRLCAVGSPTP